MKDNFYTTLSKKELKHVSGGFILAGTAIVIAYTAAAAAFIYNLGKDGKSGVSYEEDE